MSTHERIIPQHIAIIPDGNRRWAKERGLPVMQGHKHGVDAFERIGDAAMERGVKYLTFWGFSTENWKRSKREVAYLMRLFKWVLTNKVDEFNEKDVRINVLGRVGAFSSELRRLVRGAMRLTKDNTKGVITFALNYGGRTEILDMVRKALKMKITPRQMTEKRVGELLYSPDIPDPDLIIRTSGEQRLSGFMPWQGVYSELYFSEKYWPDFSARDLDAAISEFSRRQRRYGA